jgi:anthranilate phosphoribosyltransferase
VKDILEKIMSGHHLSQHEATSVFDKIMQGEATEAQIGAFIATLRMKGEVVEEVSGGAESMRRHAVKIECSGMHVVDTCGTGGDSCSTFNVSTTAAFVTAGAGVPVAKHGNRAISSKCGSADLLKELGVNLDVSKETVEDCIRDVGIGFMFAPNMHPAMKYAMGPRKELGIRTIFNMLGPLTNPAGATCQVLGVYEERLTELFAEVLQCLGSERALVVHGLDGMDEITTTANTQISELNEGVVKTYEFDPRPFIGDYADPADLEGGDVVENSRITRLVLSGEPGAARDIVCMNAAAAIMAGGKVETLQEGWDLAQVSIDRGIALEVLGRLVEATAI